MEERTYYNEDEGTIDLKQLLLYVLKKWKVILLLVLIGAIIGVGLGLMKSGDLAIPSQYDEEKALLYAAYEKASTDYEQQTLYNAQSALMQMNPNTMYSSARTYLLIAPSAASLSDMGRQYTAVLQDEAVLSEIANACGLEGDIAAAANLLSFIMKDIPGDASSAYFTLTVSAPSEESNAAMTSIAAAKLDAVTGDLKKLYGDTAVQLVSELKQYGYAENVFKAQQAATNVMSYKKTLRDNAKAMLTADEITYYSGNPTDEVQEVPASAKVKTIVKWAVIVALVFAFLGAGLYCMLFLFNGSLKTTDDLRTMFGLYVVSCLNTNPGAKKSWMESLLAGGEMQENSFAYLCSAVDALDAENTLLCGDNSAPAIAQTKQQLAEQIPALSLADKLATDDAAITSAKNADSVLLVVQLWHTRAEDLKRELEIIRKLKKPIKGVIVLKA